MPAVMRHLGYYPDERLADTAWFRTKNSSFHRKMGVVSGTTRQRPKTKSTHFTNINLIINEIPLPRLIKVNIL
ncbi:MAG: hypothetical protein ACRCVV_13160, partial [Shewanella sp.]